MGSTGPTSLGSLSKLHSFREKKKAEAPEALRIFVVLHKATVMAQQSKKGSTTQAFAQLALKLTSGDKTDIRGMKMADGRSFFSVYDIMWNTGAYSTEAAASGAWYRLLQSEFGLEVSRLTINLKFPGRGQRDTPCMDFIGLQRLFAVLDGKIGEEYRKIAVASLTRILAGDLSLVREIQSNAASSAPINKMAREAVDMEQHVSKYTKILDGFEERLAVVAKNFEGITEKSLQAQKDKQAHELQMAQLALKQQQDEGKNKVVVLDKQLLVLNKQSEVEERKLEAEERKAKLQLEADERKAKLQLEAEERKAKLQLEAEERKAKLQLEAEELKAKQLREADERKVLLLEKQKELVLEKQQQAAMQQAAAEEAKHKHKMELLKMKREETMAEAVPPTKTDITKSKLREMLVDFVIRCVNVTPAKESDTTSEQEIIEAFFATHSLEGQDYDVACNLLRCIFMVGMSPESYEEARKVFIDQRVPFFKKGSGVFQVVIQGVVSDLFLKPAGFDQRFAGSSCQVVKATATSAPIFLWHRVHMLPLE